MCTILAAGRASGEFATRAGAPAFHAAWEKRVNALYGMAVRRGIFNMDEYRHAIERMSPRHYLSASYYERSLTSLATLCVEKGVVTREELEKLAKGHFPLSESSAPGRSNLPGRERFQRGDRVRVKNDFFAGHVRMPGYIRGKPGVVVSEFQCIPFPMRMRMASKQWTSPPTTSRSALRICGRTRRTRRWCMSAFFRATWSGWAEERALLPDQASDTSWGSAFRPHLRFRARAISIRDP